MTVKVCRTCGKGHLHSLFFMKLSEASLEVLTAKIVKVQNTFELG